MKRLTPNRKTFVQTLFQPQGTTYMVGCDGFYATYLKGRNVVIIEAESLNDMTFDDDNRPMPGWIKKVVQLGDFNQYLDQILDQNSFDIKGRGIEGYDAAEQFPGIVIDSHKPREFWNRQNPLKLGANKLSKELADLEREIFNMGN